MEMNINLDFNDDYLLSQEQTSTPAAPNVTEILLPGYPPGQGHGSCGGNGTEEYETFYRTAQFVTGLVLYPIFCITGILGNSLSLIVLSHKDMATSTNVYLLALGISDSLKLLNDFLYSVMLVISFYNPTASETMMVNVYPYAHYVFQVAVCVTAWLTVSVSMDRYVSVCYPSRSRDICTIPRARTVVIAVFVSMLLLSIPSVFRYRLQTIHDPEKNVTCMELSVTELGRNQQFMIPYTWVQNFLRGIIPVFILIFLNARIIKALWKERVKGKKFSSRNRITLMLIAMVVIFIVCITPDAIMSTFFGKGYVEEDFMVKGIREITDALVAFNSAVNFLLYCSLSAVFRNTFTRVFFGRRYAKMGRFGSNRNNASRDGNSVSASVRRLSNKEGKPRAGLAKTRGRGAEEEEDDEDEENIDLIENGRVQLVNFSDDVKKDCSTPSTGDSNDEINPRSADHSPQHTHLVALSQSEPGQPIATAPGGISKKDRDVRGNGSDVTHSSGPKDYAENASRKKKLPKVFLDFTKVNGFKKRLKKTSDKDANNFSKPSRSRGGSSLKEADNQTMGRAEWRQQKRPVEFDLSYLTSSVYLGPGTEVTPFDKPKKETILNEDNEHPV